MSKQPQEWYLQAEYDLGTADAMLSTGRYIYAVFMAHLAIEKTLKGRYHEVLGAVPPKVHNLVYLARETGDEFPPAMMRMLVRLNEAHIVTRYPDDLLAMQKLYTREDIVGILTAAQEINQWVRAKSSIS